MEVAIWWHSRSFASAALFFGFIIPAGWDDWRPPSGPGFFHIYGTILCFLSTTVSAPAAIYAKLLVWITLMFPGSRFSFFFSLTAASKSELCEKLMGVRGRYAALRDTEATCYLDAGLGLQCSAVEKAPPYERQRSSLAVCQLAPLFSDTFEVGGNLSTKREASVENIKDA